MKKIITILSIMLLIIFIYITKNLQKTKNTDGIKIGFSIGSLVLDRWEKDEEIFVKRVKELGGKVLIKYANGSVQKQIKHIEQLIDENVDVIIIIPHDKDSLVKVIKRAKIKGIKVISYDRLIKNSNVDIHIAFNTEIIGQLMGKALLKFVNKGNLVIINGSKSDDNSFFFNKGIKKELDPYIKNGQINIIEEVWAKDWREKDARDAIVRVLKSGKKIDGVIAGNDRLAEAVILELSEEKSLEGVPVIGQDSDLVACQRIVEGTQAATIYKPFQKLAVLAADSAVNLALGKSPKMNKKIFDGKNTINAYIIENGLSIIDKENIDEIIINSNVYQREDIYRYEK